MIKEAPNWFFWSLGLVVMIGGCNFQSHFLYFPDRGVPSRGELAAFGLSSWPGEGKGYRGFLKSPSHPPLATVVVFHGNAGNAFDREYYLRILIPLRYRVILAEYPGYGARDGVPSERNLIADAKETLHLTQKMYPEPVLVLGESLGAAVAAGAAGDPSVKVRGLVLVTPWDDLLSLAKEKFPFLPVSFLVKERYDNILNLKGFGGRVALVGAGKDEIVPITHAERLYRSISCEKRFWKIPEAHHNDWLWFMEEKTWQEIMAFVFPPGQ